MLASASRSSVTAVRARHRPGGDRAHRNSPGVPSSSGEVHMSVVSGTGRGRPRLPDVVLGHPGAPSLGALRTGDPWRRAARSARTPPRVPPGRRARRVLVLGGRRRDWYGPGSPEALEATQHLVVAARRGAARALQHVPDSDWLLATGPQSVPPRGRPGMQIPVRPRRCGRAPAGPARCRQTRRCTPRTRRCRQRPRRGWCRCAAR